MFDRSSRAAAFFAGTFLAALSQNANAADAGGDFMVHGAGIVTCEMFVEATEEERLHAETWWAGYTTAMNRVTGETYNLLGARDYNDANAWLETWCRENPAALYIHAVHQMLENNYPDRTRKAP